MTPVR